MNKFSILGAISISLALLASNSALPDPTIIRPDDGGAHSGRSVHEQLVYAAIAGNLSAARKALADGANPNFGMSWDEKSFGYTALMAAANNGFEEIAEALIDRGADVNARDGGICGSTSAVWLAAYTGRDNLVALLVKHGADLSLRGGCSRTTPLEKAIEMKRPSTAALIRSLGGNQL